MLEELACMLLATATSTFRLGTGLLEFSSALLPTHQHSLCVVFLLYLRIMKVYAVMMFSASCLDNRYVTYVLVCVLYR